MDDQGALRQERCRAGVSVSEDISVNADLQNLGVTGLSIAFGSAGEDDAAAHRLISEGGARLAVVTRGAKRVGHRDRLSHLPLDSGILTGDRRHCHRVGHPLQLLPTSRKTDRTSARSRPRASALQGGLAQAKQH
jgi:hypothetical protein